MTAAKILICVGKDLAEVLKYYIWAVPAACLGAGVLGLSGRVRGKKLFRLMLFLIYAAGTAWVVFFSREPGSRTGVDLAVLSTWGASAQARAYVIENVLLFIPPGILLPMLWDSMKNPVRCTAAGAACSILIEAVQYMTRRGFCQTDDVAANTLGIFLGWGIQQAAGYIIRKRRPPEKRR